MAWTDTQDQSPFDDHFKLLNCEVINRKVCSTATVAAFQNSRSIYNMRITVTSYFMLLYNKTFLSKYELELKRKYKIIETVVTMSQILIKEIIHVICVKSTWQVSTHLFTMFTYSWPISIQQQSNAEDR